MAARSLRATVRALRDLPFVGSAVRGMDRAWWWRTIRRSTIVDAGYYAAQLGLRGMPRDLAIAHYVIGGFRRGRSLNPLFDEIHAGGVLPEVFRVPAMYAYLVSERHSVPVHPWWDSVGRSRPHAPALEHLWQRPEDTVRLVAGGSECAVSVREFRAAAMSAGREWSRRPRASAPFANGDRPDLLVRVVQRRDRRYARKLAQAADFAARPEGRAVIAMVDPDSSAWVSAAILRLVSPGLTIRRYSRGAAWGQAIADATTPPVAGSVVVLDARADFTRQDVDRLLERSRAGVAVMPVHRAADGTVVGVGVARVGTGGYRILEGHPFEDAERLGAEVEVPHLAGRSFAAPGTALAPSSWPLRDSLEAPVEPAAIAARVPQVALVSVAPVLDEPDEGFSIPGARRRVGRVDPDSTGDRDRVAAEAILETAGFAVIGWDRATPRLEWRRPAPGAQRWAIKICAPAGVRGEVWGDTHFAQGLANALRRQGHTVVIDAFGAARRSSAYLDEVSVSIRGPYRIDPPDTGTNLQWIISHPDEVTRREAGRFDAVFAASEPWAEKKTAEWGMPVLPLLECTDVDKFTPRGRIRGDDIVFVGTARGIARPSVVAPLRAGVDVKVYGPDWRPFIPVSAVVAESIPNDELPARYETASVVLNDQWPAMRREGFIAMRPFDVVAVGGRVISERVHGIEELFGGAVVAYDDEAHLVRLLRTPPAELFPDDEILARLAERVRTEHSFDARAATLAAAAAVAASGQVGHGDRG